MTARFEELIKRSRDERRAQAEARYGGPVDFWSCPVVRLLVDFEAGGLTEGQAVELLDIERIGLRILMDAFAEVARPGAGELLALPVDARMVCERTGCTPALAIHLLRRHGGDVERAVAEHVEVNRDG